MTVAGLTIKTFGGHDIQSATYSSLFVEDSRIFDTFDGTAIETERPGNWPVHVRVQPNALPIAIEIEVLDIGQDNFDQLKEWFNPKLGEQYLIATDGNSVDRRILCVVSPGLTGLVVGSSIFKAHLRAASGFWEFSSVGEDDVDDPEELDSPAAINDSDDTFEIDNQGNFEADVIIDITPTATKSSADSYTKRRRVTFAHRSETRPMDDPVNPDGYSVELSEAAIMDTMDDAFRVFNYGREKDRWLSSDGSKIWTGLQAPVAASQLITLGADIDDTAMTLTAGNSRGFGTLPAAGFIAIDTERIQYTGNTGSSLTGLTRGAGNTVAASHSAGASIYRVPHPFLDILYGKDTPGTAPTSADLQPLIDLDNSTNAQHISAGPYYNNGDHRSRAFQRVFIDEGASSQHLRSYDDGAGNLLFEDTLPVEGKPQGNNAEIEFPVPIKATTDAVTLDYDVPANLLLQVFALDREGNESRLITQPFSNGSQTGQTYSPGMVLTRLRLNARLAAVLGSLDPTDAVDVGLFYEDHASVTLTYPDSGTESITLYDLSAIEFELTEETSLFGFIIYADGDGSTVNVTWSIHAERSETFVDELAVRIGGALTLPASPGFTVFLFDGSGATDERTLPAGKYYLAFKNGSPSGSPYGRYYLAAAPRDPLSFFVQEIIDRAWAEDGTADFRLFPTRNLSPIFAVLSRTADPQSDVPLQTGNILTTANLTILLDDDTPRTPLIAVGDEEESTFYHHTWRLTDEAGRYIDVNFPGTFDGLRYSSKDHAVYDLETGLPISNVRPSDPNDWPRQVPGTNTWTVTDPAIASSVGALSVTASWRSAWL